MTSSQEEENNLQQTTDTVAKTRSFPEIQYNRTTYHTMSSPAQVNAFYGSVALSLALGLSRTESTATKKFPTMVSNCFCLAFSAVGCWYLTKAVANIKIGITRTLGIPLESHQKGYKRRLGFLERWYVAHSRSGQHTGFMFAIELESAPENATLANIGSILRRVSSKCPWLRTKVKRDGVNGVDSKESLDVVNSEKTKDKSTTSIWGDDLYFEVQDPSNNDAFFGLREVVLSDDVKLTEGLQQILEEEGAKEWHDEDPDQHLWRVTVVRQSAKSDEKRVNFSLILAFHHGIMDGIGSIAVVQNFLDESSGPEDEPNDNPQMLSPPMEDFMPTVPTLGHILLPVLLDRVPSLTPYFKPSHWQGVATHDTTMARQSQLVACPMSMDGEKLKAACRRMNLTVNSISVATLSKAIAKTIGNKNEHKSPAISIDHGSATVRFKVLVAKSERANCNLPSGDHGAYVSGPQVYVTASSSADTTNECQIIGTSFQKKLRTSYRAAAMDMGLCPFIQEDWIQFAKKYAKGKPNGVSNSFEFSNLGKIKFEEPDTWAVKDFWFAQGHKDAASAVTATVVRHGPLGENIRAVLSSFPEAVPRETLQEIAETWEREMQLIVAGSS